MTWTVVETKNGIFYEKFGSLDGAGRDRQGHGTCPYAFSTKIKRREDPKKGENTNRRSRDKRRMKNRNYRRSIYDFWSRF